MSLPLLPDVIQARVLLPALLPSSQIHTDMEVQKNETMSLFPSRNRLGHTAETNVEKGIYHKCKSFCLLL